MTVDDPATTDADTDPRPPVPPVQRWMCWRSAAHRPAAISGVDVVVSAVHDFAGPGSVMPASVDRDGHTHLIHAGAHGQPR
jgi:hypothetical protein